MYFVLQTELSLLNCEILTCYSCKNFKVHLLTILPLEMRKPRSKTVKLLGQGHKASCTKLWPEPSSPDLPRCPFFITWPTHKSVDKLNEWKSKQTTIGIFITINIPLLHKLDSFKFFSSCSDLKHYFFCKNLSGEKYIS